MTSEQPPGEPPKSESLPPPDFDVDDIEVAGGTGEKPQERVTGDVVGEAIDASVGQKENESISAEEPPAPEKQPAVKEKKKKSVKPKAGVKKANAPPSAPPTRSPVAVAATPPAPPAPAAQPRVPRTPEEAGMIGTGWKEERAAGEVGVPARRERTGGIAPLDAAAEPLHARAEVTTPSLENPAFRRYLDQINERGAFTGLGRAGTPELLKSVFECRRTVAQGVIEFYGEQQITGDLGLPFGKKEIAPVISAHIEKLSLEQPERVVAIHNLLVGSRELPRQIAALEARKQKLASGEELREATAQIGEKKKMVELAKSFNRFLGPGRFGLLVGKRFNVFTTEGRKNLKQVKEAGLLGSMIMGGGSIFREGKIGKELKRIDAEVSRISTEKAGDLAVTERLLQSAKARLHALKMEILGTGAVHEETAEIVRKGIQEAFRKMLNPAEPSVEGYEAAEKTLHDLERVSSSADPSVLMMDYLRYVNPEEVRVAIQKKSEGEAAKALRALFFKTLENPRAPERLNTLIAALEPWLLRTKVGSRKNKLDVGLFILEQIKDFHDTEIINKDAELKNLRALVLSGMARPEDAARLREKEAPLQMKDTLLRALHGHVSSVISARERRAPPSPPLEVPPIIPPPIIPPPIIPSTPTVGSSETPPVIPKESPPAGGGPATPRIVINEMPSPEEEVPVKTTETQAGGAESAARAPEKLSLSTFQDVLNLPVADLSRIFRLTTMDKVSAALSFATPAVVEKVRSCLIDDDKVRFDRLQGLGILNSEATVEQAQKEIVEIARKALEEKTS